MYGLAVQLGLKDLGCFGVFGLQSFWMSWVQRALGFWYSGIAGF